MRHVALGLFATVSILSCLALCCGAAVRLYRRFGRDPAIDTLIRANSPHSEERLRYAKPMDWAAMNRVGERRWQDALRAQRRHAGKLHEFPRRVWAKGE